MATNHLFWTICLVYFVQNSIAFGLFDTVSDEVESCDNICKNSYPLHTYDKDGKSKAFEIERERRKEEARVMRQLEEKKLKEKEDREKNELQRRGTDAVNECVTTAGGPSQPGPSRTIGQGIKRKTQTPSTSACREAHDDPGDEGACTLGCSSQLPTTLKRRKQIEQMAPPMDFMSPLMYMHSICSNMIDKVSQHATISWSFYVQADNGRVVVVKSEPKFIFTENRASSDEYKTSNYIETNLAALDNSATPNLRHSQMHAVDREIRAAVRGEDKQSSDWLGCIAKKTGLPRMLLSVTIFISGLVMIWLCITTAVTAPEHRIKGQPQKLSIPGDLEYLRELGDKALLATIEPQDKNENAPPLPIKIKVERV